MTGQATPPSRQLPSADHWHAGKPPEGTEKCPGICPRHVSIGTSYCCSACRVSSENGEEPGVLAHGDHPMLSHSEGCDERDQQRRPHAWSAPATNAPQNWRRGKAVGDVLTDPIPHNPNLFRDSQDGAS